MANNELITAINILSDNVTLDKPSESICIDTENNRIGILTDTPHFQLDISGNFNGIGTPQITLTSKQGITTNNSLPLIINANTVIKETLDVCNNAIFLKNISGQSITTIELSSNNIYCNNFYANSNKINFNNNISFVNSAIDSDVSVNGDICCNILRASNLSIQEISGDISFIGNFDFSGGHVTFDASLVIGSATIEEVNNNILTIRSDDRLKHNEKNITNGLEIMRQLEPQIYQKTRNFKHPDFSGIVNEAFILEAGLIAQEVEQINDLSFSVNIGNEIIPYSLNYNNIFVFGLAAIKELDKKISDKEKISSNLNFNNIENLVKSQNLLIQTLNQKISNLENRISNLEK
jgi:hypothetical protein